MSVVNDLHGMFSAVKELAREIGLAGDEDASHDLLEALRISTVPGEIIGKTGSLVALLRRRVWNSSIDDKLASVADFVLSAYNPN
jgi:hypothetical protein